LDSLEPAVVPPQATGQKVDRGLRRELDFAGDLRALSPMSPGADHQPLGRFLGPRQRLVVHGDLARPGVIPARDMKHRNVGIVVVVINDRHSLRVPERRLGSAAHRIASTSQASYSGTTRSGVVPVRRGRLSACWRIRSPLSISACRSLGIASAALLLGAPIWKIQFMNRSSNAPPCRIPLTPQLDSESIGIIVARWGGLTSASACWVPPG